MASYTIVRKDPDSDDKLIEVFDGVVVYGDSGGYYANRLCHEWNLSNPMPEGYEAWVLVVPGQLLGITR